VYFDQARLFENLELHPRMGDYVEFDNKLYEITLVTDDRPLFGKPEMKQTVVVKGRIARENDVVVPRSTVFRSMIK
jgi:hypothetical protein